MPKTETRDIALLLARIEHAVGAFRDEVERAAHSRRLRGGQQVPYHGDFAGATPYILSRLEWWARFFAEALSQEALDAIGEEATDA